VIETKLLKYCKNKSCPKNVNHFECELEELKINREGICEFFSEFLKQKGESQRE